MLDHSKAVCQNGFALEHAHEHLKGDREIVMQAVSKHGDALQYATEEIQRAILYTTPLPPFFDRKAISGDLRRPGLSELLLLKGLTDAGCPTSPTLQPNPYISIQQATKDHF